MSWVRTELLKQRQALVNRGQTPMYIYLDADSRCDLQQSLTREEVLPYGDQGLFLGCLVFTVHQASRSATLPHVVMHGEEVK